MELKKIPNEKGKDFKDILEIYMSSFPADERRELGSLVKNFGNPPYCFYSVYDKGLLIGIFELWNFDSFVLIEHIAIREDLRNQGIETRIMKKFIEDNKKIIVVEIEKPETNVAKRRIRFWKRLNFKINRYDYIQPAYSKGKNPVPMFLISYPGLIKKIKYPIIKKDIYEKVYNCNP